MIRVPKCAATAEQRARPRHGEPWRATLGRPAVSGAFVTFSTGRFCDMIDIRSGHLLRTLLSTPFAIARANSSRNLLNQADQIPKNECMGSCVTQRLLTETDREDLRATTFIMLASTWVNFPPRRPGRSIFTLAAKQRMIEQNQHRILPDERL